MLAETLKMARRSGFEWQMNAVHEIKRVVSEILGDSTPLEEVDLSWLEMRRSWVLIVSSDILEFPFCGEEEEKEINSIRSALYRVSLAVCKAQSK